MEDNKDLILKIKTEFDDLKKQELIEELLKIYLPLIKEEVQKIDTDELEIEDLMQEGYLAFIKAIENYDLTKNVSFEDFLRRSIKSKIKDAIEEYKNTLSIPEHISNELNMVMDKEQELFNNLKRPATLNEVAIALDITVDELKELKSYALNALSIDNANLEKPLIELVNNYNTVDEEDDIDDIDSLKLSMETLNEREKEVVKMYYGLDGYEKLTNLEISKKLNISKEKVRQIITLSKIKLKREMEDYQ